MKLLDVLEFIRKNDDIDELVAIFDTVEDTLEQLDYDFLGTTEDSIEALDIEIEYNEDDTEGV
jgi:hypothetical protein